MQFSAGCFFGSTYYIRDDFSILVFLAVPEGKQSIKGSLISVTKQVIRAAAVLGIDEAGTRLMGAAWGPFKTLVKPVFKQLEKRFPKFSLLDVPSGSTPSPKARALSEKAISVLGADKELQKMLRDGFYDLEEGQIEIKEQISKFELRLEAIELSIDELSSVDESRFQSVLSQLAKISKQLDKVGQSVEVETTAILVPLAFDLPKGSIEAYVKIFIPGVEPVRLSVDKNRTHAAINVLFPHAGTYTYRLEHNEVTTLYKQVGNDYVPELVPISSLQDDEVEIVPNSMYLLERSYTFLPGRSGQVSLYLRKKLTKKEKRKKQQQGADLTLDDIDDLLS